jgi:hypothetical protein
VGCSQDVVNGELVGNFPDLGLIIYWRQDMTRSGWVALALALVGVGGILIGLLSRRISAAVVAAVVVLITIAALIALR